VILDLFAGPGGWSEGIRQHLGLTDIGIEWDAAACQTRAAAGHHTVRADVAHLATASMAGRITGLIASPPCQAWSRAGKRLGIADQPLVHQAVHDLANGRDTREQLLVACKDPRSLLAAEPMRYLCAIRPEWVALEEVPDVLPLFRQYAETLRGWGYSVWAGELNAADYGVPQTRRRAILVASRVREAQPPAATHAQHAEEEGLFGPGRDRWVSMAEALGWGATDRPVPTVTAGGGKTGGAEPFPTQARAALAASRDRGDWALRSGQSVAGEGRAERRIDEPAVTITSRADLCAWVQGRPSATACATGRISPPDRSPSGESHGSSPDTVRITVAEASVLQSFPADYPWQGSKTKQFEQVGNAVPPLLAAHVVAAATGLPMRAAEPAVVSAA
jgi:DNA (cytosine-5)-methyltransferase 1